MRADSRVKRWRDAKRQHGLKAVTIWLSEAEERRLKDLAVQERCSPSAVMQRALAQFEPSGPDEISRATDIALLRQLIREEIVTMQAIIWPVTVGPTVTVAETKAPEIDIADTVTDTPTVTEPDDHKTAYGEIPAGVVAILKQRDSATAAAPTTLPLVDRPREGQYKLTSQEAAALRAKRAAGVPIPALMQEYRVARTTLYRYLQAPAR